jgi:subtilisin family serine protease
MSWDYDFDGVLTLNENEYIALPKIGAEVDPAGIGIRLLCNFFSSETAPLLIPEIKIILINKKQYDDKRYPSLGDAFNQTLRIESNSKKITIFGGLDFIKNTDGTELNKIEGSIEFEPLDSGGAVAGVNESLPIVLLKPRDIVKMSNQTLTGAGVKIAIIDDSFNFDEKSLPMYACSFNFTNKDGLASQNADSHGTKALSVISGDADSIAPMASIYLARIDQYNKMTPSLIAAIMWAKSKDVDIISVSSAYYRKAGTEPDGGLVRAVNYVKTGSPAAVIVAATNNSHSYPISSLAVCDKTLAVNGTSGIGGLQYQPQLDDIKFARVDCISSGDNVQARSDLSSNKYCGFSGSSSATAIVAGSLALFQQKLRSEGINISGDILKQSFITSCCKMEGYTSKWAGSGFVDFS